MALALQFAKRNVRRKGGEFDHRTRRRRRPRFCYATVKEFRKLSYEDRLRKLNLTSLVDMWSRLKSRLLDPGNAVVLLIYFVGAVGLRISGVKL